MTENQKRQKEYAREEAIKNTYDVCATGEKAKYEEYDRFGNQINNE